MARLPDRTADAIGRLREGIPREDWGLHADLDHVEAELVRTSSYVDDAARGLSRIAEHNAETLRAMGIDPTPTATVRLEPKE